MYKRPYCEECKQIYGNTAIGRVLKCQKCGRPLILKNFNPHFKLLLGLLVIGLGCLTFFVKELPVLWFGGILWGGSIIVYGYANWEKIKKMDTRSNAKPNFVKTMQDKWRNFVARKKIKYREKQLIVVECKFCRRQIRVPINKGQIKVRCPKCELMFKFNPKKGVF